MNANLRRMISGIAALGIALSGMALGAGSAWAGQGKGDSSVIEAGSVAIDKDDARGTITISGGEVEHTFNGYRLGYLTSISYDELSAENEGYDNASMTGYTLETNRDYKGAIETALGKITVGDQTLLASYKADNNYCASECEGVAAGAGDPNPLGWFFANYGDDGLFEADDTYEDEANWGGDAKDGNNASVLRQFATAVSTAIKGMGSTPSDVQSLTSSEEGRGNTVPQGFYLLRDATTIDAGGAQKDDQNKETQSAPILVSTTYTVDIPVANEGDETDEGDTTEEVTFTSDAGGNTLGEVELKNSTPTVTKKVVTDENGTTAQNQPDYAVGDTVYYKLTATLPYYTGYAANATDLTKGRVYKITDIASKGLTVDTGTTRAAGEGAVVSVKVTSGNTTQELVKDTDYTVTTDSIADGDAPYKGGWTTTIDLAKYVNLAENTQSAKNKILEGGTVTVILKAKLNKDALISDSGHAQGNPSKDSLTYSNEPEDVTQTHTTPGDEVNVYTYRFRLHKTDKAGDGLGGATFWVSAPGETNKWLKWNADDNEWAFVGTPANEDAEAPTVFTSDDDGNVFGLIDPDGEIEDGNTVNLDRLDSGTYTVKETKAPEGYTQAFLPEFTFTIDLTTGDEADGQKTITGATFSNADGDGKDYVTDSSAIAAEDDENGAWQYTVYNAKNLTQLPMTGGAGLAAVIAVGVLLGGAGIAAAVRSRKSNTRAVRA